MQPSTPNEDFPFHLWSHVRQFAVPFPMIELATARRTVGDWAGACAAARVDTDLNLRTARNVLGAAFVSQVRADLQHLAPDLLRWHFPRISPHGLLRPGLTISLSRYRPPNDNGDVIHLVARTPPAWADAGQRISLALWQRARPIVGAGLHPHPHPDRRFRLDLHRHLWDSRSTGDLAVRSGATQLPPRAVSGDGQRSPAGTSAYASHRWAAEAELMLRADGHPGRTVSVRLGIRRRLVLSVLSGQRSTVATPSGCIRALPVLPEASTRTLPDLALLQAGLIPADRLHPLVASALVPDHRPAHASPPAGERGSLRTVECRGATHRVGVVDGVLTALDHDPDDIRREELLQALGGAPAPCVHVIHEIHRCPEGFPDIADRLRHGDAAGALAVVEDLLGSDALLHDGPLHHELDTTVQRRHVHQLYRAGLTGYGPPPSITNTRRRDGRARRRPTTR